jgi:MFS family permease
VKGYDLSVGLRQGALSYLRRMVGFDRSLQLFFVATLLSGIGTGIFQVAFNLYALSLGMSADLLGRILTAQPLAFVVAGIPLALLGERVGYRRAFLGIFVVAGLGYFAQAAVLAPALICLAVFLHGLAMAGNFVVRLPLVAAYTRHAERSLAFSASGILMAVSMALGSLLGGYIPTLFEALAPDLVVAYRYTLYGAALLTLVAALPVALMRGIERSKAPPRFSLKPYLWGMGRVTVKLAVIELCLGLVYGLSLPFMNVFFVHHLGASREFFGAARALAIIPVTLATALAPALAASLGTARMVSGARLLVPLAMLSMAITRLPLVGAISLWGQRVLLEMSQAQWFAYAMDAGKGREKSVASAWLNITFQFAQLFTTPLVGYCFARSNYALPYYLAAAAAALSAVLTYAFFASRGVAPVRGTQPDPRY